MNPHPSPGQRWSWEYNKRNIDSLCIIEIVSVDSDCVHFKYVQIVRTNYGEEVGWSSEVRISDLNDTIQGIFVYLEGQDKPQG